MKKLLSILLTLSLLIGCCSVFPAAAAQEAPVAAAASVTYTDTDGNPIETLPAGKELVAGCDMRRVNAEDKRERPYVFFTVVYQNGRIFDAALAKGKMEDGETAAVTVSIPENTDGVTVESYLWDSLFSARSLAPKAVFGSAENMLAGIYVDGKSLEGFDGSQSEAEKLLSASCLHTPQITAVARDSSARVEIEPVTAFPQRVGIKVVAHSGAEKSYTLALKQEDGTVSSAYSLKKGGEKVPLPSAKIIEPYYGTRQDGTEIKQGDSDFSIKDTVPEEKTLVYSDRTFYYYTIPDFLIGKTAVQTSLELLRYDEDFLDKANCLKDLTSFEIDRSADVYVYGASGMDWLTAKGYQADSKANVGVTFGDDKIYTQTAYKKTYIVPEGETVTVTLGNNKNSADTRGFGYWVVVDFAAPNSVAGLANVSVDGVGDIGFDPEIHEYDVDILSDSSEVPSLRYDVLGVGASVKEETASSFPGTTTVTVTSGDGKMTETYTFRFQKFENVLSDLKVGGKTISGFDKDVLDYIYQLPYGATAIPEVTAEANQYVTVDVQQATFEDKKAVITLTDVKGNVETYTVTFQETLTRTSSPVNKDFMWSGVLTRAYSGYTGNKTTEYKYQFSDEARKTQALGYVFAYDQPVVTMPTYEQNRGVTLLQLDLNKLTGIDLEKTVKLKLYGGIKSATADILLYDASGFEWADENLKLSTIRDNYTQFVQEEKLVASGLERITENSMDYVSIDVTDFVKQCIEKNNMTPTIAVYGKLAEGTGLAQRNAFYFTWQSGVQTHITYYQYD